MFSHIITRQSADNPKAFMHVGRNANMCRFLFKAHGQQLTNHFVNLHATRSKYLGKHLEKVPFGLQCRDLLQSRQGVFFDQAVFASVESKPKPKGALGLASQLRPCSRPNLRLVQHHSRVAPLLSKYIIRSPLEISKTKNQGLSKFTCDSIFS